MVAVEARMVCCFAPTACDQCDALKWMLRERGRKLEGEGSDGHVRTLVVAWEQHNDMYQSAWGRWRPCFCQQQTE